MCPENRIKIAPSILSADFSRLGEQVLEAEAAGAAYIHVDIMDGQFVPAITMGPEIVKSIRTRTKIPLDVHMMVSEPVRFVPDLCKAGASIITVHAEACENLQSTVQTIKDTGLMAGVAIKPETDVNVIEYVLESIDLVLVMTVNPGLAGQRLIHGVISKIKKVRKLLDERGINAELEVDGGINPQTAGLVVSAGARVLVAGSAVYNNKTDIAEAIGLLIKSAAKV